MKTLVGIDIGGTKICICVGDETGRILASKRIATQPLGGSKKGLSAIEKEIRCLLQELKKTENEIDAIGISTPGPIDSKMGKMLSPPNLPGWENTLIKEYFVRTFHKPIQMNNDANAAVLAEYHFGSAKKTAHLVYLTVSTGMGGGAIVNHQLVQGASDTAAEVGHFILDPNGPLCSCGLQGCFEAFCGGAALAFRMQKEIKEHQIDTEILRQANGQIEQIDAACLVEAVKKRDVYALKIWDIFIEKLAQGIGVVLMTLNPKVLLLGTIAVHSQDFLLKPLKKALLRYAWKESIHACKIEPTSLSSSLSELSGLALAIDGLERP